MNLKCPLLAWTCFWSEIKPSHINKYCILIFSFSLCFFTILLIFVFVGTLNLLLAILPVGVFTSIYWEKVNSDTPISRQAQIEGRVQNEKTRILTSQFTGLPSHDGIKRPTSCSFNLVFFFFIVQYVAIM